VTRGFNFRVRRDPGAIRKWYFNGTTRSCGFRRRRFHEREIRRRVVPKLRQRDFLPGSTCAPPVRSSSILQPDLGARTLYFDIDGVLLDYEDRLKPALIAGAFERVIRPKASTASLARRPLRRYCHSDRCLRLYALAKCIDSAGLHGLVLTRRASGRTMESSCLSSTSRSN
jgi:hypothetical protein